MDSNMVHQQNIGRYESLSSPYGRLQIDWLILVL